MYPGNLVVSDQAWLQCISCGNRADVLSERQFLCPKCGSLFDVRHNLNQFSPQILDTFDSRRNLNNVHFQQPEHRSGVWRFLEWVYPSFPREQIITLGEGMVPIIPAGKNLQRWLGDVSAWIIQEGNGPTGAFKDFGMTVLISGAKAAGIMLVMCSSTGDTSAALAAYCAAAGIQCIVILPKGLVTAVQIVQPLVHGAKVILLPTDFDGCMRIIKKLVNQGLVYPGNSLNPLRIEGHKATVFLAAQFFNWNLPDWIVVPTGNGSNCSSVGKALRELKEMGFANRTQILACQSEAANPLYRAWQSASVINKENPWGHLQSCYSPITAGETAASAARIGAPVSINKVIRELTASRGLVAQATERQLLEAVQVCGSDGNFICPQTGMALAGLKNAILTGQIAKGAQVLVVSTATGLKFTESAAQHAAGNIIETDDASLDTVKRILKL